MNKFFTAMAFLLLLAMVPSIASGQKSAPKYDADKFRKEPVWIAMMNDPQANFFETVEAFRTFWKDYKLPGEPMELEGNDRFEKEIGLEEAGEKEEKEKKRVRKSKEFGDFSFQVKQFKGWYTDAQPWVQEDGHVMTLEERQQIIDAQQKELKAIENKH